MTLDSNNYFGRYYNWIYGYYPKDVCSFFWGSLLAIILTPLLLPGKFLVRATGDDEHTNSWVLQTFTGVLIWLFSVLFSLIGNAILNLFDYEFIYWWSISFGGFLLGIGSIGILVALMYLIGRLLHKTTSSLPKTYIMDNTKDFIGAIRGKYCTKITWIGNEED